MDSRSSGEPGGSSRQGRAPADPILGKLAVTILGIRHGTFPQASRLNPRFDPHRKLLLATLEIRWAPRNPRRAIASLEESLLAFSPGFHRHECRGMETYHAFSRVGGNGGSYPGVEGPPVASGSKERYDAGLALAHLLEHALIDFLCEVTGEMPCSGITGAHRSAPYRYDLLVECRELEVGCCCLALALSWIQGLCRGHPMGSADREVLSILRWIHRRNTPMVFASRVARVLGWREDRVARALAALQETGYLETMNYAMNLSGMPVYRPRGRFEEPLLTGNGEKRSSP